MNINRFIKVTPKGGGTPVILPDGNRTFYLSQGATITTPTEDEVRKAHPEYGRTKSAVKRQPNNDARNANDALKHQVQKLNDEVASLKKDIQARDERIAALESENAQLRMVTSDPEENTPVAKKSRRKSK